MPQVNLTHDLRLDVCDGLTRLANQVVMGVVFGPEPQGPVMRAGFPYQTALQESVYVLVNRR